MVKISVPSFTELIEQNLTSHQTHYRSYRGRFLQVIWPNQQCQSTEGNSWCCR